MELDLSKIKYMPSKEKKKGDKLKDRPAHEMLMLSTLAPNTSSALCDISYSLIMEVKHEGMTCNKPDNICVPMMIIPINPLPSSGSMTDD